MKVLIDNDVIAWAMQNDVTALHELILHLCRGRHQLIGNFNPWFVTLDATTATAYQNAMNLSLRAAVTAANNVATVHVKMNASGSWTDPIAELSLGDALRILREPLGVIVENSMNDWNFLRNITTQGVRQRLDHALAEGWVDILHGGGADIVSIIEGRASLNHKILRTFALFDSDRHHPDELAAGWQPPENSTCQGYITECAARQFLGDRYWMLARRYIESYLPRAELEKHEAANRNVPSGATAAFFNLPEQARWYFDMKKGFNSDCKNSAVVRQRGIFAAVNPDDRLRLASGFGRPSSRYSENNNFNWDPAAKAEAAAQVSRILRLI